MAHSLYIHIPFCMKKCIYCDFYSIPGEYALIEKYTDALCCEILLKKDSARDLETVYIGGGTPTLLPEGHIARLLQTVREVFTMKADAELTIEANPGTVSREKLRRLRREGINRISIGIQSLVDRELAALGRIHSADDALLAVKAAQEAGFDNISLDLIYGIPGQTGKSWEYTLMKALETAPQHFSTYELTPEEETPLARGIAEGNIVLPCEEEVIGMYYHGMDILKGHGYLHYEISNFAKPGRQCLHNLNYWNRGEYLGIGAGAHSFYHGKRAANVRDANRYVNQVNKGILPVSEENEITESEAFKETVFLGMRKTEGIHVRTLPPLCPPLPRGGWGGEVKFKQAVAELIRDGLVEFKGDCLRFTDKGLVLSNEVLVRLL